MYTTKIVLYYTVVLNTVSHKIKLIPKLCLNIIISAISWQVKSYILTFSLIVLLLSFNLLHIQCYTYNNCLNIDQSQGLHTSNTNRYKVISFHNCQVWCKTMSNGNSSGNISVLYHEQQLQTPNQNNFLWLPKSKSRCTQFRISEWSKRSIVLRYSILSTFKVHIYVIEKELIFNGWLLYKAK